MNRLFFFVLLSIGVIMSSGAEYAKWRKDKKYCEVCIKSMTDIKLQISHLKDRKDVNQIEGYLARHCSKQNRNLRSEERIFCNHILPITRQMSTPLAHGLSAKELCKKMHRIDHTICDYKYKTVLPKRYTEL